MENARIITEHLKKRGLYPVVDTENEEDGLILSAENHVLHLLGNPCDLIELADYLVSLALSGENVGQHWHIDHPYMINAKSEICEIILCRKSLKP